jgi:hypothetical protein
MILDYMQQEIVIGEDDREAVKDEDILPGGKYRCELPQFQLSTLQTNAKL